MVKHAPFEEVQAGRPDFDGNASFQYTKHPGSGWQPGQGLNGMPDSEHFRADSPFREVDPTTDMDKAAIYKMMTWGVTPRPIAFVSTRSPDGQTNLAPISYFNTVASDPPTVMISIVTSSATSTGLKDTSNNIIDTKEFCISLISEPWLEAANYAAIDSPENQSEWPLTGLTKRESKTVKPPHVGESAFSMECVLSHQQDIHNDSGKLTQNVFFGRIKRFHVKEHVIDPDDPQIKILPEKYKVVGRLGGWTYSRTISGYEVPRPDWKSAKAQLEEKGLAEKSAL